MSIICKPLFDILKKDTSNKLVKEQLMSKEADETFSKIVELLSKEVLLTRSDRRKPFISTTDASNLGVGAILSQIQNGEEKIICFYSSLHNKAQSRYLTTDQELLAVISAVKHFRHYLIGQKYTLRTAHKALIYMARTKDDRSRIYR